MAGSPGCGKTNTIINIILRAVPAFEKIYVIHCDPEFTKEYERLGDDIEMLSSIPDPEFWPGLVKSLVIIDDLELKTLDKTQKRNLDRLYGFCSTHKNLSVLTTQQDLFGIPAIIRRCSNLWILWRISDLDSMSMIARKSGLKSDAFNSIFNDLMLDKRDSLWIDQSDGSPAQMRKNGYTLIHRKDGEDSRKADLKRDKYLED